MAYLTVNHFFGFLVIHRIRYHSGTILENGKVLRMSRIFVMMNNFKPRHFWRLVSQSGAPRTSLYGLECMLGSIVCGKAISVELFDIMRRMHYKKLQLSNLPCPCGKFLENFMITIVFSILTTKSCRLDGQKACLTGLELMFVLCLSAFVPNTLRHLVDNCQNWAKNIADL